MRRIVLRILLWSLALAAVTGVLAVLVATQSVMVRVTMTGFVTTGAAGLLLPITFMLDRARLRPAGLFAMSLVVAIFVLTLCVIWLGPFLGWQSEEALGWMIAAVGGSGVLALGSILARLGNGNELASRCGLAVCATAFAIWVVASWVGFGTSLDEQFCLTGWFVVLFGGLAVVALAGLERPLHRPWRWLGVACSLGAALIAIPDVWHQTSPMYPYDERALSVLASIGALVAYTNFALLTKLKPGQRWLPAVAIVSAALTAVLINIQVFTNDLLMRFIAAGVIVTACATLALRILAAINRRGELPVQTTIASEVTLYCPRCAKKQTVPAAGGACAACGLRVRIQIEEPTCPSCGYLIYGASDRCPECGAATRAVTA